MLDHLVELMIRDVERELNRRQYVRSRLASEAAALGDEGPRLAQTLVRMRRISRSLLSLRFARRLKRRPGLGAGL